MVIGMKRVVVVGSVNYDMIFRIPSMIQMGETMTAKEVVRRAGGKGANQAVQLAKLGMQTCFIGCVGSDESGKAIREEMEQYGVDTKNLRTAAGYTGMAAVHALEDGNVFATLERGANYRLTREDIDAAKERIRECDYMLLQLEIPYDVTVYAIETAKQYGLKVVLNAAPAGELPEEVKKNIDYLAVNEVEAGFYLREEIRDMDTAIKFIPEFRKTWNQDMVVICTLGKAGAVICGEQCVKIPAVGTTVVETTGAGDSFLGGFVYALCERKNLEEAGKIASYCSAFTIGRVGAQEAMPNLQEIVKKYGKV